MYRRFGPATAVACVLALRSLGIVGRSKSASWKPRGYHGHVERALMSEPVYAVLH
jgi:hypothetical protein